MVAVDGNFTRIPYFSDLYLTAVTLDSNRQVYPLFGRNLLRRNDFGYCIFVDAGSNDVFVANYKLLLLIHG